MATRAAAPVSGPRKIDTRHRFAVTLRLLAALGGGYLLSNAFAILLARLLLLTAMTSRADGVLAAVIASFPVYVGAVLWAFAARSAARAWAGLLATAGVCGAAAWLLGSGAAA